MSTHTAIAADLPPRITLGSPAFLNVSGALFLAGFSTFSLLYCVQPLLPAFAKAFAVGPAASSLALSLTTGFLAIAIFGMGALSQRFARRDLMFGSMLAAAVLNLLAGVAPAWPLLLTFRALEGLALGGVPAVAMAYLAEEIDAAHLGKAIGLYIGGTAFGGMMGRVGMGLLLAVVSWRSAMVVMGGLDIIAAIGFFCLLPPSRYFAPGPGLSLADHLTLWGRHLRNGALLRLFAIGFILTSVFVGLFNYATFRLALPPFRLNASLISLIFLTYVLGMFGSSAGGGLADRFGRRAPLLAGLLLMVSGVLMTLGDNLVLTIAGISLVTVGFFIAHAVASAWVGRLAGDAKSHAASLYLLFYYLGSSVTGVAAGWAWQAGGWGAVVATTAALGAIGVAIGQTIKEGDQGRRKP